ncbi:MAG: hypothetical protein MEQ07_00750 [Aquimonas sp.]|nr:hypothetical protein [Aquimonas sp.]
MSAIEVGEAQAGRKVFELSGYKRAEHLRARQTLRVRLGVWRAAPAGTLAGQGNQAVVSGLDEPVLFVVGADDKLTPPRFARAPLAELPGARHDKALLVVPGRAHANARDGLEFRGASAEFVASVAAARPALGLQASPAAQ